MKFTERTFSKRFPPISCAIFCVHEPPWGGPILHRGTAAALIMPDGQFWVGVTLCSPSDVFVKKVGRAKAIGRAYQSARRSHINPRFLDPHTDSADYSQKMKGVLYGAIAHAKQALEWRS